MASADKEENMIQLKDASEITPDFISKTIDAFDGSRERQGLAEDTAYYEADNPHIMNRKLPMDSGPDNRLPVSYARRIINLVSGYMYKPGLVSYAYEGEDSRYEDAIRQTFRENGENIKTEQVGKQASIYGIGYEYHYVQGVVNQDAEGRPSVSAVPRFVKLPAPEVIAIWDKQIEPALLGFIRYVPETQDAWRVTCVNDSQIQEYLKTKGGGGELKPYGPPKRHYYGQVPLAVFKNNEECMGDFDPVVPLIDAYDVLMSDSMNEFDRFAWAYLLLKGMALSPENAEKVKRLRAFENLDDTGDVAWLTKQMDTNFIKYMSDTIRNEIHRQSGIPNLEDYDSAGASGKTMSKFIYLMELFTDPKESYFRQGLAKRIELVTEILSIQARGGDPSEWRITMNRNTPDNSLEQAEIFAKYSGFVSHKTLLQEFADFVDDPVEEIERLEAEGPLGDILALSETEPGLNGSN